MSAKTLPSDPFTITPCDAPTQASNKRILAGYATLLDLYDNWEKYAGKGEEANGDNVRRQIGTVGNKSPLFGIRKVLLKRGLDLDLFEEFDRFLVKIDSGRSSTCSIARSDQQENLFLPSSEPQFRHTFSPEERLQETRPTAAACS
jgi:hypothetical protein